MEEYNIKETYDYFAPLPETLEELKVHYRKLAFQYHPDKGGNVDVMKAVNNEYDTLFLKLKNIHKTKDGKTYSTKDTVTETAEQFKDLINELMKMEAIIIEIIGCFVWVTGDTKIHKDKLKELNFQWHSKKIAWYLKPEDYLYKSRREYGLDEIREMYGSSGQMNSNRTHESNEVLRLSKKITGLSKK